MNDSSDSTGNHPSTDPFAMAARIKSTDPAPVHLWNPPYCGDIDMKILADGTWMHEGRPIRRPSMVRLFASILKREGEKYFLVTPVEKVGIEVEDSPFLMVDMEVQGRGHDQSVIFTSNVGERVTLDSEHPLTVDISEDNAEPRPRILVRDELPGLIKRSVFYRLVDLAVEEIDMGEVVEEADKHGQGQRQLGVWSRQRFFPLGTV